MYTRVFVSPVGDIPGCILHSARIIRKTPPIMIIRTLHRNPDVCPRHVRSGGSWYVTGKRGQFPSYSVIARMQRCRWFQIVGLVGGIDTFDYCRNRRCESWITQSKIREEKQDLSTSAAISRLLMTRGIIFQTFCHDFDKHPLFFFLYRIAFLRNLIV